MDYTAVIEEMREAAAMRSTSTRKRDAYKAGIRAITALLAELEQMKRAIHGDCDYCLHHGNCLDSPCKECTHFAAQDFINGDYWEWRGPKEESE